MMTMSETAEQIRQRLQALLVLVDQVDERGDTDTLQQCDAALRELVGAMETAAAKD